MNISIGNNYYSGKPDIYTALIGREVIITVKSLPYTLNLLSKAKDDAGAETIQVQKADTPLDYNVVMGKIEELLNEFLVFRAEDNRVFLLNSNEIVMVSFIDD